LGGLPAAERVFAGEYNIDGILASLNREVFEKIDTGGSGGQAGKEKQGETRAWH
jgi:hypothetical protein